MRASDRTVGPILAAQPQVRASLVRVFFLRVRAIGLSLDGRSGATMPVLGEDSTHLGTLDSSHHAVDSGPVDGRYCQLRGQLLRSKAIEVRMSPAQ